jgi:hypothetical protein
LARISLRRSWRACISRWFYHSWSGLNFPHIVDCSSTLLHILNFSVILTFWQWIVYRNDYDCDWDMSMIYSIRALVIHFGCAYVLNCENNSSSSHCWFII